MSQTEHPWVIACRLWREGRPIEDVLSALRRQGCSKAESIRALKEATGWPLTEAKRSVHESAAWADVKERDDRLLDELESMIPQLGEDKTNH
jgi:ribosomal protein L7/L12